MMKPALLHRLLIRTTTGCKKLLKRIICDNRHNKAEDMRNEAQTEFQTAEIQ